MAWIIMFSIPSYLFLPFPITNLWFIYVLFHLVLQAFFSLLLLLLLSLLLENYYISGHRSTVNFITYLICHILIYHSCYTRLFAYLPLIDLSFPYFLTCKKLSKNFFHIFIFFISAYLRFHILLPKAFKVQSI